MLLWLLWLSLAGARASPAGDCALLLGGPPRTSAFDYRLNLLRGNALYEGQNTCITYEAVDQAYLDARKRILVSQPTGDWKAEDFASVGELMLDISINLARTYGLSYEEVEKGLPLIDTSRTLIREVCPPVFSHVECRAGKYRRLDGLCNNLQHPTWGSTMAPFQRLIGPLFADGINAPRVSHTGRALPAARVVSRTMHPDDGFHDHAGTIMVIAWGQFMDHDYTLTGTPLDPRNRNDPEECCNRPPHRKHPYCNELHIPEDDYFYRLFGIKCLDFVRAFPSPRPGCRLGSRVPFNTLTGSIDGNTVYGVTDHFARKLRTGYGGLLRMNPVFEEYGLKDLLPLKLDIPDEGCTRPNKNMYCFEAGEIRVNEQLILTVMHTLMAREHNRAAGALAEVNPHWDDETLYQEARRITVAEIQHITYNEFLPILLGKEVMEKFGLVLEREGYWDGYDQGVNPDVLDAFAAAAYRFGHSLLPTAVERWSKAHKFIASKRLSDLIRRPYDLYRAGVLDEYVMGLMNQVAQAMDDSITQEVTNHLFKKVGARFGMDLVSLNMQRGREFGLPGYMEFRKFCGLPPAKDFNDLYGSMPNETVRRYESIFEHPVDVDLWSGGVSERPLPGSMLGPTFACIIATQFSYSRRGDRFWYELPNQPSSFTAEQLAEVRKARLARVICDNTDIIDTVQLYPMVLPDHELNPRVPCKSGIIPSIDFSKWAEPAPFHGTAKQFITEASVNRAHNRTNETFNGTHKPDNHEALPVNVLSSNNTMNETTNKTENTVNSDVLLKYLYKKANVTSGSGDKPKENHKNALRRKKRSNTATDNSNEASKAQLIVDYKTSHASGETGAGYGRQPVPFQRVVHFVPRKNYITGAADFNIKTVHDSPNPINSHLTSYKNNKVNNNEENSQSTESTYYNNNKDEAEENTKVFTNDKDNLRSTAIDSAENEANKDHLLYTSKENDSTELTPERIKGINNNKKEVNNYNNDSGEDNSEEIHDDNNITLNKNTQQNNRNAYYKEKGNKSKYSSKDKVHQRKHDDSGESDDEKLTKSTNQYSGDINDSGENNAHNLKSNENSSESDDETFHKSKELDIKSGSEEYEKLNNKDNIYSKAEISDNNSKESSESDEKPYNIKRYTQNNLINVPARHKKVYDSSKESDEENSNESRERYYKNDSVDTEAVKDLIKIPTSHNKNGDSSTESDDEKSNKSKERYYNNDSVEVVKDLVKVPASYNNDGDSSTESDDEKSNKSKERYYNNDSIDSVKDFTKHPASQNNGDDSSTESDDEKSNKKRERYYSNDSVETDKTLGSEETTPLNGKINDDENSSKEVNSNRSSENSDSIENIHQKAPQSDNLKSRHNPTQDVDVGTFSYDIMHINDKGHVEPNNHVNENYEEASNEKSQVKINAGEVKPVVEISHEDDSSESSEEKHDQSFKGNLGYESNGDDETSAKIKQNINENQPKLKSVKQEFERIPLNYNHDENKGSKMPQNNVKPTLQTPVKVDYMPEHNENEETSTVDYDNNLNLKFNYVPLKLPEITVPQDILNFEYEKPNPVFDYTPYNHEHRPNKEDIQNENESDSDSDDDYDDHHSDTTAKLKDSKHKQNDDDQEEDLYEKFVRERFGKRDSFEKRSERLEQQRYEPTNKQLFKTIDKLLKKADETSKQAEQSGDPNAGYIWTLEYGQNLNKK